ncbi:unnamed protein product, partial [Acanthoscelides obtectus]
GQHPPYRAIGLGQRPFLETPFSHLRELELDLFKKQGVRTSQSADGLNAYKQESQGVRYREWRVDSDRNSCSVITNKTLIAKNERDKAAIVTNKK